MEKLRSRLIFYNRMLKIVLGLFLCALTNAETVKIYDLDFPIQSIESVGSGAIKINVLGSEEIIPESALNFRIVSIYFDTTDNSPQLNERIGLFPINRLKQFVELTIADKNKRLIPYGLAALTFHPESSVSLMDEIIWSDVNEELITGALKETFKLLVNFQSNRGTELPIITIGAAFNKLPKSFAYQPNKERQTALASYLEQHYIKKLIIGKTAAANNMLSNLASLYSEKPAYIEKLKSLQNTIPQIVDDFKTGKESNILALRDLASKDAQLQAAIIPAYNEFIHNTAANYLDQQQFGNALWVLSKIIFETRTPQTHKLVAKSLATSQFQKTSPILRTGVAAFLNRLALQDPLIKHLYQQRLAEQIYHLLHNNQPQRVDIFFGLLQAINPDPAILNDQIRLARADYYYQNGESAAAIAILESLGGALPSMQKNWIALKIAWMRHPFLITIGIILAIILLVVFCQKLIIFVKNRKSEEDIPFHYAKKLAEEEKSKEKEEPIYNPDNRTFVDEEIPIFVQGGAETQLSPTAHEYMCLLKIFNLAADASQSDIKRAYREEMKKLHPDSHAHTSPKIDTKAIMQLKAAYNRLVEMDKTKLITEDEKLTLKKRAQLMHSW